MDASSDYDYSTFLNDSDTSSEEPGIDFAAFQVFAAVWDTLVFCISMPGNSFLLWVLVRDRAWRTADDILLLQLTVSNLCFSATLPLMAINALHYWVFGHWGCGIMKWVSILGLYSNVAMLAAMTLHHYVNVVHASSERAQASIKSVLLASFLIWLVCAAVSIKQSVTSKVLLTVTGVGGMKVCSHIFESLASLFFDIYIGICLFFLVPFFIITFCYIQMWVKKHHTPPQLILGIIVGVFVCLAPNNFVHFLLTLVITGVFESKHEWIFSSLFSTLIIYALTHLHCCIHPLFHIAGAYRFRRHLPKPCRRDDSNISLVPLMRLHNDSE